MNVWKVPVATAFNFQIMKNILYIAFVLIVGCKKNINKSIAASRDAEKKIVISNINDEPFEKVNKLLKMDSYAILSSEVLLADIKRVISLNDNIYVLDSKNRIICYNKDGSIKYKIDAKGRGPGEYPKIMDFSIDETNNKINLYAGTVIIMSYSLTDGNYISTYKLDFIPKNIASFKGGNYFYQPSNTHRRDESTDYFYNLMWSEKTKDINKRYFPHDLEVSNYRFGLGNSFFYNDLQLFFINQFDDIVYSLKENGIISPKFQIKLPNLATLSDVKQNPDLMDLLESDYSIGITDIFQCGNILSFSFSKKGNYYFVFYDLKNNKNLYCGQRVWSPPTKELLVYYPISGVIDNQFFSLVNPMAITYARERNPDVFPADLMELKESDNPVLMFYSIK